MARRLMLSKLRLTLGSLIMLPVASTASVEHPSLMAARAEGAKTCLAVVGLDHDRVWGLLEDVAKEPEAELVAIADPHPEVSVKHDMEAREAVSQPGWS